MLGAACRKKPGREQVIQNSTREMAAAVQRLPGGRVEVAVRPRMSVPETGEPAVLLADDLFITLPDASQQPALEKALDGVARRYSLARLSSPPPSSLHWAYGLDGRATQFIHVIVPGVFPAAGLAPGAPRLAVIIDDLGSDRAAADDLFSIPVPLTVSILPHHEFSREIAGDAHRRGDQVLLHLPMEPEGANAAREAVELHPGMSQRDVDKTVADMLAAVPFVAGVNNHEGSLATSDPRLMGELMPFLRRRHLFFIDSRTAATTVAYDVAQRDHVRSAYRKVFLDDTPTHDAVLAQLTLAENDARRDGWAIAIGHPHPETLAALRQALPELGRRGIRLVFASDLAR
jgi:uncharacterized protein